MSQERIIIRKTTPNITLPEGATAEEEGFIRSMYNKLDNGELGKLEPRFGHALSALTVSRLLDEETDPIKRQNALREQALALVGQFGEKIIPLLKDDFRIALDTE